ncbi:MAG TPA: hypothetical protein VNO52_17175 [Methylomirabilota bacterium]|nr:hypothetical protein [Methylomirabilota bacterium]
MTTQQLIAGLPRTLLPGGSAKNSTTPQRARRKQKRGAKTTKYTVTVNETNETASFDTLEAARLWVWGCERTLALWGGDVTFTCKKITTEDVAARELGLTVAQVANQ